VAAPVVLLLLNILRVATLKMTRSFVGDILLVLDQSASIIVEGGATYRNWCVVLEFAKSVADAFRISSNRAQVGVIKFNTEADVVFYLDKYKDNKSLCNAIVNIDLERGQANLAAALRTGRWMFRTYNGARDGVPRILIMLTDGTANVEEEETEKETTKTKEDGIAIFTVGVGNDVNQDELEKIASKPEYFFFATDFNDLGDILEKLLVTITTTTDAPTNEWVLHAIAHAATPVKTTSTAETTWATTTKSRKTLLSYFLISYVV